MKINTGQSIVIRGARTALHYYKTKLKTTIDISRTDAQKDLKVNDSNTNNKSITKKVSLTWKG